MKQPTAESNQKIEWIKRILHQLRKANAEQLRAIYYLISGYLGI